MIGHAVHEEATRVLRQFGVNASNFAARQLTAKIASDADLILTMTKAHRNTVLELAPRQLHKTFTLAEASYLASDSTSRTVDDLVGFRPHLSGVALPDIQDPIGKSGEVFDQVGVEIARLLQPVFGLFRCA